MSLEAAFIAAHKFGLGPRPGDLNAIAGDPRGWLLAQVRNEARLPDLLTGLPSAAASVTKFRQARFTSKDDIYGSKEARRALRLQMIEEIFRRGDQMVVTATPLLERMTAFWANHFTVSSLKRPVAVMACAYEREAIRPHVFGRFADMLRAVVGHPAMLIYLDNDSSIGPNSRAAQRRRRRGKAGIGLNENLARELLELHTLGVGGGYTQADVVGLAKILSGWSYAALNRQGRGDGKFRFRRAAHEPGTKRLLGKTYDDGGIYDGESALINLARHPATARFIAGKLVRHFGTDRAAAADIERIAAVFRDSDGDLAAVTRAVIALPSVWQNPAGKAKTPYEYVIAAHRALGAKQINRRLARVYLRQSGHIPFRAPSPAGWSDKAADWLQPEAVLQRVEWARLMAAKMGADSDARDLARHSIWPYGAADREILERAASNEDGVALVLASPQFQRR